jgi:argininosuccinate lyase
MGRLSLPPNSTLFELLYEPGLEEDRRTVLPYLLQIDAAHVLMLARQGILPRDTAAKLLAVNRDLGERLRVGESLLAAPGTHRGLYWLYEQEYIQQLGPAVGGAAHVARSRNDINATVARLRMRDEALALLGDCDALLTAMILQAKEHTETLMSFFTHFQPAQPSTLGHYLTGVLSEILRSAEWLLASFATLERSPMGAAAGAGTSFPIDREEVARLLGFPEVIENSADAVASRDYAVQFLSALSLLGTTLTRLAQDLQSWASFAYGFIDWPDDLVSTSSIMPQKRNAFVLENIRGQATRAIGALVDILAGLKNTPFTNGVEVSSEAMAPAWPAFRASRKALRLMTLLIGRMEARPERMRTFLDGAQSTMTALADLLVARHGLPFRTAHDAVGALLSRLPEGAELTAEEARSGLETAVAAAVGRAVTLDRAELEAALDPWRCLLAAGHGGGPAPESVRSQLSSLAERHRRLHEQTVSRQNGRDEARSRLAEAVALLLGRKETE